MKKMQVYAVLFMLFAGGGYVFSEALTPREQVLAKFSKEEMVEIGKNIYQTPGAQTCQKCHRGNGEGEGWAGAAVLKQPHTWNAFLGLGGYEALAQDPAAFRKKMEAILENLITTGAIKYNLEFSAAHPELALDWDKTIKKAGQFDMMMWGVAQPEMKKKVKEVYETLVKTKHPDVTEAEMAILAPHATLEYVKTFEEPNQEDTSKPKIWG